MLQIANPGDDDGGDRVSWQSLDSDIHIRRRRPAEVQLRSSRSGQTGDEALLAESWSRRRSITGREVEQWTEGAEEDNRPEVHMESSVHDVGVSGLQSTRSMETQPGSSPVEDEDHPRHLISLSGSGRGAEAVGDTAVGLQTRRSSVYCSSPTMDEVACGITKADVRRCQGTLEYDIFRRDATQTTQWTIVVVHTR